MDAKGDDMEATSKRWVSDEVLQRRSVKRTKQWMAVRLLRIPF
jgi:hypothetical protein